MSDKGLLNAAQALGFFIWMSSCAAPSRTVKVELDNSKITPAYCAGLKIGEAFKEILK